MARGPGGHHIHITYNINDITKRYSQTLKNFVSDVIVCVS